MEEVLFGYTQLSDKDTVEEDSVIDYIILLYLNLAAVEINVEGEIPMTTTLSTILLTGVRVYNAVHTYLRLHSNTSSGFNIIIIITCLFCEWRRRREIRMQYCIGQGF